MDGIAIAEAEPRDGQHFALVGTAYAGEPFDRDLQPGEAVRISTGAVVPDGALRVLPKEWLAFDGDRARVVRVESEGRFIRPAGSDFSKGQTLLDAGSRLHPGALALVAAANRGELSVVRRPRIGIATSGDELVAPGRPLGRGDTIDSGSTLVAEMARAEGGEAIRLPNLPDTYDAVRDALTGEMGRLDILVVIGGASVGDRDHLRPVVREIGGEMLFERVAMRPGKPSWAARLPRGPLLIGLPGNPGSAFVSSLLFLKPAIAALSGRGTRTDLRQARFIGERIANGPREAFLPAIATLDDGALCVRTAGASDSGLQLSLAHANALLRIRPDTLLERDTMCDIVLFGSVDRL